MKGSHVKRRITTDRIFKGLVIALSFVIIVPMFFILFFIVKNGISVIDWTFLTTLPKPMGESGGGISNAVIGTIMLIAVASIILRFA